MKVKGHVALEWPGARAFAPAATTARELLCLDLGAPLGLCPVCDPPSLVLEGATRGVRGWFAEVGGDRLGRVNLDVLCGHHCSSDGAFPAGPSVSRAAGGRVTLKCIETPLPEASLVFLGRGSGWPCDLSSFFRGTCCFWFLDSPRGEMCLPSVQGAGRPPLSILRAVL